MAIITNNPFGSMSGSVGELVMKTNKHGKQIVSAKPDMSRVKPSVVQKIQRNKLKVAMEFLSPLSGLMKIAYKPFRKNTSGFDAAKSYFLKEALIPTDDGYIIDYGKAMVTFGDLRIPEGIHMVIDEDDEGFAINLQWEDNTHQALAYPEDTLLLVLHVPEDGRFIYYRDIATRVSLSASIYLENYWKTKELQLWMAFMQPEAERASPSVYLGVV
ncbi:DUF6266 family protein [Planktosalinus lacus]|nr:DUF6266 family protein [Planktosalinus lacus]